jgi:hypothetical protein
MSRTPLTKALVVEVVSPPVRGALDHHDAFPSTACSCRYCSDYNMTKAALESVLKVMDDAPCDCELCQQKIPGTIWPHSRGCPCDVCRQAEKANTAFCAAANRRDFWSEMSYHAVHDPDLTRSHQSEALMAWAAAELNAERARGLTGFWSVIANRYSIGHWIDRFETVALAAIAASGMSLAKVRG